MALGVWIQIFVINIISFCNFVSRHIDQFGSTLFCHQSKFYDDVMWFSADKYVREVVNEGGEDDEIVDSDGEVIWLTFLPFLQCCMSVIFLYGSGPTNLYQWRTVRIRIRMDPAFFIHQWPSRRQEKYRNLITKRFFCLLLFRGIFTTFFKNK